MLEKKKELVKKALENTLSGEEREIILLRFFAEDGKILSYKKITQQKSITVRKV